MKTKLTALSLLFFTLIVVIYYPLMSSNNANATISNTKLLPAPNPYPNSKIEVVFVLDTTGSMSDLIHTAKEKIWSIASTMASSDSAPEIKMGLIAYRDRGDEYITKRVDLSLDLDSVYAQLMEFTASGGGDGPESVNQALHEAIHKISWSQDKNTYKVVFLVGDAPPHMDYLNDIKYPKTIKSAFQKGIYVNTILCGEDRATKSKWKQIAALASGTFFQVEQGGNAIALTTPFDEKLAELSKKMDSTRLSYGNKNEKNAYRKKMEATDKLHAAASISSRARRATFNISKSGVANQIGEGELVDDVNSGRVELSKIERQNLPEAMRSMSPQARQKVVQEKSDRRQLLKQKIKKLAAQRTDYLNKKIKERGGAEGSLDAQIYSTIRSQAAEKGMVYDAEQAAY